ncbi:hypothetical protein SKAU_G00274980 [Synaphobranchus kaupii]|uniref:Uncharacterized protein n=1 Tax=Synaphobranchus kaupii TaxID=118154 RepID=A0A9Q1F0Y1_SYNKA|nr:hypothetical protein SKAU_G00274980 [Synaphobranchus kaupii]
MKMREQWEQGKPGMVMETGNQLLRMATAPVRRWRARPGGRAAERGGYEEGEDPESGDCDDEDDCGGGVSGAGPSTAP